MRTRMESYPSIPAPRPKTNLHCILSHWNIPYLIIEEGADVFTQPLSSVPIPAFCANSK